MSREGKLLRNTTIIAIGKICTQMITFFLLPLYTGILSTGDYGTVDLLSTLISLLLPIVILQVDQGVFRLLIENRDDYEKKSIIISTSIISVLLQIIIYFFIFIIVSNFLDFKYKLYFSTNVIVSVMVTLLMQISRGLGDNKSYSFAGFISAISTILFNVLFLIVFKLRVEGMLLGTLCGQLICFVFLFLSLKLYKYFKINFFDKIIWKKMLRFSLPLIPNAISWWIFNASDRVIVSYFLGVDFNGILAAASKLSYIYISVFSIFVVSWTESITININDDDIEIYFNKLFDYVLSMFIAFAFCLITFMPIIFPIFVNSSYNSGYNLIPILIIASLFNVIVGLISVIYVAKKNTKAIAMTSIVSAITNIITHLLLIKHIGLYAAVFSTFIAYFSITIYRLFHISKTYFKIRYSIKKIVISIFVLFLILVIFYFKNIVLLIMGMLIVITFSIYINKDLISVFYVKLFKR